LDLLFGEGAEGGSVFSPEHLVVGIGLTVDVLAVFGEAPAEFIVAAAGVSVLHQHLPLAYLRSSQSYILDFSVTPVVGGLCHYVLEVRGDDSDVQEGGFQVDLASSVQVDDDDFVVVQHVAPPPKSDGQFNSIFTHEGK